MKSIAVVVKAMYRGFKITFHEVSKEWSVAISKESYENEDLEKVKDYVDRILKSEFKPFEAFSKRSVGWGQNDKYDKVTITSVDIEDAVWVKTTKGSRGKVTKGDLVAITPENEATIKHIQELDTEMDRLHKEKEREEKKLTQPAL
jgi:hypothetical protein